MSQIQKIFKALQRRLRFHETTRWQNGRTMQEQSCAILLLIWMGALLMVAGRIFWLCDDE
jgi:hypothetical protein